MQPASLNFGSLVDRGEYQAVLTALPPQAIKTGGLTGAAAPSRVVLTNLPSVQAQGINYSNYIGDPGTCEAQSFGYGLGSYTAARTIDGKMKWSAALPQYQASAAWLFAWSEAQGDSSCPRGGLALPYLRRLVETGAPSIVDVPYDPGNYATPAQFCSYFSSLDPNEQFPDQSNFIIGSYRAFTAGGTFQQSTFLPIFRNLIAAGHAIAFSGKVAPHYAKASPPLTDNVFYLNGTASGGHGQLIVGYDDTIGEPSDPGAFLVQNSFGTGWNPGAPADPGHNGRVWYSYSGWFATQSCAAVAYPAQTGPLSGTPMTANSAAAPAGNLNSAYNYADTASQMYRLVVNLQFADAILDPTLTVTDASDTQFIQPDTSAFRTGYLYVSAATPFAGTYQVAIAAQTLANVNVTYTTTVTV